MSSKIKNGIYKHYKGGKYEVLFEAEQTENGEKLVVYKSLKDQKIWARPLGHFNKEISQGEKKVPRFNFIEDSDKDEFEDKYRRALADYDNLMKRTIKEKQEFAVYANEQLLYEIIPVYDNLKMSLNHVAEADAGSWVEGVKYIVKQFKDVLGRLGVEEIETVGKKFDPVSMEAVEGKGGKVIKEIKPGYKLKGKNIIPAKVVVG